MVACAARRPKSELVAAIMEWFDEHERDLPWRSSDAWGVLVSEFMLQQTPVDRVIPVWQAWRERWPQATALAQSPLSDAIRAWGRLGYPRRAVRLHASAVLIAERYGGIVPSDVESLRSLPGVGEYTAAAVRAFAFGRRSIVLDTNVRRVLARTLDGRAEQTAHISSAERAQADDLWPQQDDRSARWSAAVMEFGAVVCTSRAPTCERCPVTEHCSWMHAGRPPLTIASRRQPAYVGSHREVRGRILQVLRDCDGHASGRRVATAWPDVAQRERALASLVADGLAVARPRGGYALPG